MSTGESLNTVSIKKDDMTSIIKSINPTKVHGFDNISISMIELGFYRTHSCPNFEIFIRLRFFS